MGRKSQQGRDGGERPARTCASCGRTMTWRRAWANTWDSVRWCSAACRRRGLRPIDTDLEQAVLGLLDRRARDASICPSEAARAVASGEQWRDLMEPARSAARRLAAADLVTITQQGRIVDPSTAKGPIRIRRR